GSRARKSRTRTAPGTHSGLGSPDAAARRSPHGEIQAVLPGGAGRGDLRRPLDPPHHPLSTRLRGLEDAEVVARHVGDRPRSTEYRLPPAGDELTAVVERLGRWGARWAFGDPRPEELDPALLVWKIRGRIHHKRLPPRRVVVEFEFSGKRRSHVWLVLKREEASVCLKPPGFDTDLLVTADLGVFYCV